MKLLDLFCGAGGAAMGYHRAGFEVVGVDCRPQPRYPFPFVRGDALEYALAHGREYDVIHASPPCQRYSTITPSRRGREGMHPDLIDPVRDLLLFIGLPWIVENVPGAPLGFSVELCGAMFGLKVYRHRLFEMSHLLLRPDHPRHRERISRHGPGRGKVNANGWATVTGAIGDVAAARLAMGIDWMVQDELTQAVPPAYTEWIGRQLIRALTPAEAPCSS